MNSTTARIRRLAAVFLSRATLSKNTARGSSLIDFSLVKVVVGTEPNDEAGPHK